MRTGWRAAMRWVVGGRAVHDCAASASQMGRFETEWLASVENLAALADLFGRWIDRGRGGHLPDGRGRGAEGIVQDILRLIDAQRARLASAEELGRPDASSPREECVRMTGKNR